eukprot:TRINITY_DN1817_c0_g5_i1.p1 TRINITY_DN1817_c0_g5~~TRINITY_DN1817_c0_g5_i1.p1  ORF type:complete len:470 (+),score=52.15 TRINITY_DN1817_c0_g5_i1:33-1412(+)
MSNNREKGTKYTPSNPDETEGESSWGSRTVDVYHKMEQIGEGTYGQVYKARNIHTNEIVALKKIRMDNEKEGFPITAIREIKILKELNQVNIVKLKDIVTSKSAEDKKKKGSIYLVFEYMEHDLAGLIELHSHMGFREDQIKCYMKQLLEGLHYLHTNNVLHRDIKASNLLISDRGVLKLADFGLARPISKRGSGLYTNNVITLWYRPPELLLGAQEYGSSVDCWSVGCILAELLWKKPIFPGKTEIDQIDLIFRLCGSPTDDTWPDAKVLPWFKSFKPKNTYKPRLREVFQNFPPAAIELIEQLLTLDPKKRITADKALRSPYFWTEPLPCETSDLPVYPSSHEYTAKKRRQRQQNEQMQQQQQARPAKRPRTEYEQGPSDQSGNYLPNRFPAHGGEIRGERGAGVRPPRQPFPRAMAPGGGGEYREDEEYRRNGGQHHEHYKGYNRGREYRHPGSGN